MSCSIFEHYKTQKSMKKFYSILFFVSMFAGMNVQAETITINQTNFTFSPNAINVNVGDVIHFVWSSGTHNTTSVLVPNGAASWEAPLTMASPTFDYTVEVAGVYGYVCTIHQPNMAGGFNATAASSVVEANISADFNAGVDYNNHILHVNISNYQPAYAQLSLIDITGKEVATLLQRELGVGEQRYHFDVAERTSGIYFVRLEQKGHIVTRRVLLN